MFGLQSAIDEGYRKQVLEAKIYLNAGKKVSSSGYPLVVDGSWETLVDNLSHLLDRVIDENLQSPKPTFFDADTDGALEGYGQDREILRHGRNAQLALQRKDKDNHTCMACGFRLEVKGKYVAECHHQYPVSAGIRFTKLEDLVTLCPTCHRLAYLRNPPYSVEKIRKIRNEADSGP